MVGADTQEGVSLLVVWQTNMAHLGMQQAMHQAIIAEAASADSGANGQVDKRVQALRATPAPLAKRRSVDTGIEADRHFECPLDGPNDVGLRPARFGCCGYVAIV